MGSIIRAADTQHWAESPFRIRAQVGLNEHLVWHENATAPVYIRGRANDRNGHWRCTLREDDSRDNNAAVGVGRSAVLARAILAAVLRLSMTLKKDDDAA